jgi:hypothetical protein
MQKYFLKAVVFFFGTGLLLCEAAPQYGPYPQPIAAQVIAAVNGGQTAAVTNKMFLNVRDFGAYVDGVSVRQTNGLLITPGSSTVVASNWVFSAADVGKNVEIVNYMTSTNAVPGLGMLSNISTTITAVNSATNITLGISVPFITAQYHMDYGHNDTPVVQKMVDFITTNGGTGVIFVPNGYGRFLFLDDPWHTNASANPGPNAVFYSQIVLPYWKAFGDNLVNIEFLGESPDLPRDTAMGSRMVCSRQPLTSALTWNGGSGSRPTLYDINGRIINYATPITVIGACATYTVSGFNNGGMSTTSIGLSHITLDTYYCAPYSPLNMSYMWEYSLNNVSIGNNYPNKYENNLAGGSVGSGTPVSISGNYMSAGTIFPANDNSIEQCYNMLQVDGYDIAEVSYECVRGDNLFGRGCFIGILQMSAMHPSTYGRIFPWNPYYGIVFGYNQFQPGADFGHAVVHVGCLDMENIYAMPVYNPLGVGVGTVNFFLTGLDPINNSINANPMLELYDLNSGIHSGINIGSNATNSFRLAGNDANNGFKLTLPNGSSVVASSSGTNALTLAGNTFSTLAYSTNTTGLTNSFLFNESGNLYSNAFGNLVLSKYGGVTTNADSVVPGTWSLDFKPTSGNFYVANSSGTPFAFGTNDVTFSLFIKPRYSTMSKYGYTYIFDTLNVGGTESSATSMQLTIVSQASGSFANSLQLRFGNNVVIATTNTVNFNQWNHIIVERLLGVWSIWINGAQDVQYSNPTYSDAGAGLVFGNQSSATWYGATEFTGLIDKPQVWNRGLSAAEIAVLQLGGVPLTFAGNFRAYATNSPVPIYAWVTNNVVTWTTSKTP